MFSQTPRPLEFSKEIPSVDAATKQRAFRLKAWKQPQWENPQLDSGLPGAPAPVMC